MKRKALLYPAVLSIMLILLVLGAGLLSQQVGYRRASSRQIQRVQALWLAQSGLEEARLKLERDPYFPPSGEDIEHFSYCEEVRDFEDQVVGRFEVRIDLRQVAPPTQKLLLSSQGITLEGTRACLQAEWDLSQPAARSSSSSRWLGVKEAQDDLP